MYDAVGGVVETPISSSKGGIYEVPSDMIKGCSFIANCRMIGKEQVDKRLILSATRTISVAVVAII